MLIRFLHHEVTPGIAPPERGAEDPPSQTPSADEEVSGLVRPCQEGSHSHALMRHMRLDSLPERLQRAKLPLGMQEA